MTLRKLLSVTTVVAVCLAWSGRDAAAQARGGGHAGGGGAHAGGAHVGAAAPRAGAPAPTVGHAVARPPYGGHYPVYGHPGYPYYGYPYRPYYGYPYYGYGYPYYGYPSFSIGFGIGFGYGYGYYGYPYYGYAYPGYTYAAPVYVQGGTTSGGSGQVYGNSGGPAYGGVRISGAPTDAQVYADGYFVGEMAELNGTVSLTAGVHKIEVRIPGQQSIEFDVNIQPGQTITYRAR